jgi:hypothetical protein
MCLPRWLYIHRIRSRHIGLSLRWKERVIKLIRDNPQFISTKRVGRGRPAHGRVHPRRIGDVAPILLL